MPVPSCRGGWGSWYLGFPATTVPLIFASQQCPLSLPSSHHLSLGHRPRNACVLDPFFSLPGQAKAPHCAGMETRYRERKGLYCSHVDSVDSSSLPCLLVWWSRAQGWAFRPEVRQTRATSEFCCILPIQLGRPAFSGPRSAPSVTWGRTVPLLVQSPSQTALCRARGRGLCHS